MSHQCYCYIQQLFLYSEWALNQQRMRPKAEWAIDSEAMRVRGIIVLIKSNQLIKKISRQNILRQFKLDFNPFFAAKTLKILRALFATSGLQHSRQDFTNALLVVLSLLNLQLHFPEQCNFFQNCKRYAFRMLRLNIVFS